MADIRTLKLALLADTKDFIKGLDKADKEAKSFSSKLSGALKTGAMAFAALGAAAGAAAIKIGIDSVKAAIEDEKAQASLAQTLKNTTKATAGQIKKVEDYIDATQRATGVADDQLRPSLDRLVRSTNNVAKAQQLQGLALNISAGTGKDLATVTEALSKGYDGNLGALKRIGVPLADNIVKTKDFDLAVKVLSETFAGQADIAANTFEGRMNRLKIAVGEAKESLGKALLPLLERFADFATSTLVPALEDFVAGLTGDDPNSVKNAVRDVKGRVIDLKSGLEGAIGNEATGAYGLGIALKELAKSMGDFAAALTGTTGEGGTLQTFIIQMTNLLKVVNALIKPFVALVELSQAFAKSQSGVRVTVPDWIKKFDATVPDFLKTPAQRSSSNASAANYNITINTGVGDPNAIARAVSNVINTGSRYGTVSFA